MRVTSESTRMCGMPPATPAPTLDGFRRALVDYLRRQAQPPDKFSHQPRLYQLAVQIGVGLAHDDDVLFAAAWLHDLGVFVGHRPHDLTNLARWDHVAYVLDRAPGLLVEFGFPAAKIPAVLEAIRRHQPADDPHTAEGVILRDADILEQLGATGILRTVSKVGRDTRFLTFADALEVLERNLGTLPGQLRLASARVLAEQRATVQRAFLEQARAEAGAITW